MSEATLRGVLSELQLADVLQVLAVGNKTGELRLKDGDAHGSIFLSEGRIVHAQTADLSGGDAAYALAVAICHAHRLPVLERWAAAGAAEVAG